MAVMTPNAQQMPVKIVGSSVFGRHAMISDERTWNLFISDEWLLNFAGYEQAVEILGLGVEGRGLFHSTRGNFLLVVIGANIYRIDPNLGWRFLYAMTSTNGEVFIDENLSSQIIIVDGSATAYIYNYDVDLVSTAVRTGTAQVFNYNYVTYQNTFFIFGNALTDSSGSQWFVYKKGAGDFDIEYVQTLTIQTKPDFAKAAIRIPSHGNFLLVLGSVVSELWSQVPGLQTYQRQSSINIDYGVASVSTIAASDDMVCWLGINEKSSPAIMVMMGGKAERISTDGIDFLLSRVRRPDKSTAMFYRQDGHVQYILTFFHEDDNFSIMYDFNTQKFFDVTDWDFNYHPARQMAYFGGEIYFVSLKQGSLMRISSTLVGMTPETGTTYEIPRIRRCDTLRFPGSDRFIVNQFSFTIENGVTQGIFTDSQRPRIDVNLSKNGGVTYGNSMVYYMHKTGDYKNQPRFNGLGSANQFTIQMRFWGLNDIVITNGFLECYK